MIVRRRDIAMELWDISKANNSDIPKSYIDQLLIHLKKEGNLTLNSRLSELINTRWINMSDEAMRSHELTSDDIEDTPEEEMTDEEMFKRLYENIEKEKDPNFSVIRSHDDQINEILFKYARKIAPHRSYLPVIEWDLSSLAFYCVLWGCDANVDDLLFPMFSFSKQKGGSSFDFDSYADLVNELDTGSTDAKQVLEFLLDNKLEGDQSEYQENAIKSTGNKTTLRATVKGNKKTPDVSSSDNLKYFELNTTYNKLKGFRNELEHLGYLDQNLSTENFRKVFLTQDDPLRQKLKRQTHEPIVWLINKSHLGHLIKLLAQNNIITVKDYYKIAENCFLFNGEPISNTVFHSMQPPSENAKRKIDRIVAALKG